MPTAFSGPAGCITELIQMATLERKNIGFQPMSCALRMACAANFGVAARMKVLAPAPCRVAICESTVGSVTS